MTGEARNGQPPPCAAWHQGRTPPLQAARPAPPCCSLSPLSLICLPWPAIIAVQETGKEGKMQRSFTAPLWVSGALGKGREGMAGFTCPAPGPALAEGVGGRGRPCRCVMSACCFMSPTGGARGAPASEVEKRPCLFLKQSPL